MSWLNPAGLLLVGLSVPLVLLYLLKLRRQPTPVSSILLWERLLRDQQANTPWQHLKRNLLLLVQLLILAALVLALARPALPVPSVTSGSVVLILDGSASMNALDGSPENARTSRFEAARQAALTVINGLPAQANATLILAAHPPRLLASVESDRTLLRRSLEQVQPTQGTADWQSVFTLAAGAANASRDADGQAATTLLLSDGGLPPTGLPPLPGPLRYLPFGGDNPNLAVAALALRPGPDGLELFARLSNSGPQDQETIFSLYGENSLLQAQSVLITARSDRTINLSGVPQGYSTYSVQLSAPPQEAGASTYRDELALDDQAYAVYQPSQPASTLLATRANLFLERLLARLPGVSAFRLQPDENGHLALPARPYDLYIFDGVLPPELESDSTATASLPAQAALLLINPPANRLFAVTGVISATSQAVATNSPLAEFVDWSQVHVRQARQVALPDWGQAVISTPDGPLVFAGETAGRRIAVVTFDLHDSDLPLQVAFPVLFANLVDFLSSRGPLQRPLGTAGAEAGAGDLHPGDGLQINPVGTGSTIQVTAPDGQVTHLELQEDGAYFAATQQQGVYRVDFPGSQPAVRAYFAVNLFSAQESNLAPVAEVHLGSQVVGSSIPDQAGQRELWPWLAALALVLLLAEWWLYQRTRRFLRLPNPGSLLRTIRRTDNPPGG